MISRSIEETRTVGRRVAARVRSGDRILLDGPLGSGKTTFVQGLAEGLGAQAPATSPSFLIVHEYALGSGKLLRHIDLYRLSDPVVDVDRLGFIELLNDPQAITVVEWADRLPKAVLSGLASGRATRVVFEHGQDSRERKISISHYRGETSIVESDLHRRDK